MYMHYTHNKTFLSKESNINVTRGKIHEAVVHSDAHDLIVGLLRGRNTAIITSTHKTTPNDRLAFPETHRLHKHVRASIG